MDGRRIVGGEEEGWRGGGGMKGWKRVGGVEEGVVVWSSLP